jgi:hypothetical protein
LNTQQLSAHSEILECTSIVKSHLEDLLILAIQYAWYKPIKLSDQLIGRGCPQGEMPNEISAQSSRYTAAESPDNFVGPCNFRAALRLTAIQPMNTVGQILDLSGNFTMLKYIEKLSAAELERTVGFEKGRLDNGFCVVALAANQLITPQDFELKASTRWSAGAIGRSSNRSGSEVETILDKRGQNVHALKQKVCSFFAKRGPNTPAKVLPNLRHTAGMLYPDAEALGPGISSGVPQFNLVATRKFVIVRVE